MISEKISNIPVSGTMEVAAKIIELRSQGIDVIDLCVGEPDLPTPIHIKEAAIKALDENKTKYTTNVGIIELRELVRKKYLDNYNLNIDPKEIIISNGAKQSVFNSIQALLNKGDEVLIPKPYYVSYPHMIKLADGEPVFVNTKTENSYKIRPSEIEQNITTKTKALLLCNPNNPSGAVYSADELDTVVKTAIENNLYVICDEIYEELIYNDIQFKSIAAYMSEYKEKLILINGVSKSYCMTGWRIGYAIANESLVKNMSKLQSHSTSAPCTISQYASLAALGGPQDFVGELRQTFQERRDFIHNELTKLDGVRFIDPQGAFYFFVNIKELLSKSDLNTSKEFCMKLLEEEKVGTVPGTVFGMEGYFRLSYAKSIEELTRAMEKISLFISKHN